MMKKRMRVAVALMAFSGVGMVGLGALAAPAQAEMPPPCPTHTLVGTNAYGTYIWPPGCGQPIYVGQFQT